MDWLGTSDFGELAGISRQKAHRALAKALRGDALVMMPAFKAALTEKRRSVGR